MEVMEQGKREKDKAASTLALFPMAAAGVYLTQTSPWQPYTMLYNSYDKVS